MFVSVLLVALAATLRSEPAGAQGINYQIIYSFQNGGNANDGREPMARMILASDGNYYGTTFIGGGPATSGTVFQLTPAGVETVIHSFTGPDGAYPLGGVIQANDGNLYGTTSLGGDNNMGVIFRLSLSGDYAVIHSFTGGSDGERPLAGVIQATDGNLYGTTSTFNSGIDHGTVYRCLLDGTVTTIHRFSAGDTDGNNPNGPVIQGSDGFLYGTAIEDGPGHFGILFKMSLAGDMTIIHAFSNRPDGAEPRGAVFEGADGCIYGTASLGGGNGYGSVYKVARDGTFFTVLHSFVNDTSDGQGPLDGPIQGPDGNFYGTTHDGGQFYAAQYPNGSGGIYRVTPTGDYTFLMSFPDVFGVSSSPMLGADMNLYGTAAGGGGDQDGGAVYRFSVPGFFTNHPPVANAGPDQLIHPGGKNAQVKLDGAGSSDPDGDALSYVWTEGGNQIATGATPIVTFGPGLHTVTLTVTDTHGASASDDVVIDNRVDTFVTATNQTVRRGHAATTYSFLKRSDTGARLMGRTVALLVDGIQMATTTMQSVATFNWTVPANLSAGAHTLTISFAGDPTYKPSQASAVLTVQGNGN